MTDVSSPSKDPLQGLPQKAPEFDLKELLEAGCHFGHLKAKWHPKMDKWIYMEKDGVHIFDLAKTAQQLTHAYNYAHQLGSEGKKIIFVGTKKQARDIIEEAAQDAGAYYITSRWLGGLLTNWQQVRKSIQRMNKIEKGLEEGTYKGYTKYERTQLEKEANRLKRFFVGIKDLSKQPDCLFIVDPKRETIVVKEALQTNMPMIALVDSNTDPTPFTITIPANDDARGSIELIVKVVAAGYKAGKKGHSSKKAPSEEVKREAKSPKPKVKEQVKEVEAKADKPKKEKKASKKPATKSKTKNKE